jgi:hypothetical protein
VLTQIGDRPSIESVTGCLGTLTLMEGADLVFTGAF